MTDILKEKLGKGKPIKVDTWICDICERHFITIKAMPKPIYCPYCKSSISLNDKVMIRLAFDERAIKEAGKEFIKKCAKAPYPV